MKLFPCVLSLLFVTACLPTDHAVEQTKLDSAPVPLFPVTTMISPVFEGGAIGQPIPFTQFLQQPKFATIEVNKDVCIPDGGSVLLSGWKQSRQERTRRQANAALGKAQAHRPQHGPARRS